MHLLRALTALAMMLAIFGCQRTQNASLLGEVVEASELYSAPILLVFPPEMDSQWGPCNVTPFEPRVTNAHSSVDSQQLNAPAYDALLELGLIEHPRCRSTPALNAWLEAHPEIVMEYTWGQSIMARTVPAIVLGTRSNLRVGEVNSYEAEVPMMGRRPFLSAQFTYDLSSNIPGLAWSGEGSGFAKLFRNVDSGEWQIVEITLADPELVREVTPTASASEVLPQGVEASQNIPAFSIVSVAERPFFYTQSCSPESAWPSANIPEAVATLQTLMQRSNIAAAGPLTVVRPRYNGQHCVQVGYPYSGREPVQSAFGLSGRVPGGTLVRVMYSGREEDVWTRVYNPMEGLRVRAGLEDPTRPDDDWATVEIYHDDPLQPGGSRNREILFVPGPGISSETLRGLADSR